MLLDEALDILDSLSLQLINDGSLPLNKSELISMLDLLETMKLDAQDQIMESSTDLSKDELLQEMASLNSILQSKRDKLQMIISAIEHWK